MRLHTIAAAAACAVLLSIQHVPAEAASAKSKTAGSARSVAAGKTSVSSSKASRSEKSASGRTGPRDSKSKVKMKGVRTVAFAAALPVQAPVVAPEVPLTLAQLDVARLVQTGVVHCEMGQSVVIEPQARRAGAFHVRFGGAVYDMVPEETSTGAVRLSDPRAGVVWLQIPVKSMLMDARQGQRMVDACTTSFQRSAQAIAAARSTHAPSMSAATDGLGIAPALLAPVLGYASARPVESAAVPAGSMVVPVSVTQPVATALPSAALVFAAEPSPASSTSTSTTTGEPTLSVSPSAIGGTPGANGTSGAGSAGDPNLLPARPGTTAAVAPLPAWAPEGSPAGLPLPGRLQVTPN